MTSSVTCVSANSTASRVLVGSRAGFTVALAHAPFSVLHAQRFSSGVRCAALLDETPIAVVSGWSDPRVIFVIDLSGGNGGSPQPPPASSAASKQPAAASQQPPDSVPPQAAAPGGDEQGVLATVTLPRTIVGVSVNRGAVMAVTDGGGVFLFDLADRLRAIGVSPIAMLHTAGLTDTATAVASGVVGSLLVPSGVAGLLTGGGGRQLNDTLRERVKLLAALSPVGYHTHLYGLLAVAKTTTAAGGVRSQATTQYNDGTAASRRQGSGSGVVEPSTAAASAFAGDVHLLDAQTGSTVAVVPGTQSPVVLLAMSAQSLIVVNDYGRTIRLFKCPAASYAAPSAVFQRGRSSSLLIAAAALTWQYIALAADTGTTHIFKRANGTVQTGKSTAQLREGGVVALHWQLLDPTRPPNLLVVRLVDRSRLSDWRPGSSERPPGAGGNSDRTAWMQLELFSDAGQPVAAQHVLSLQGDAPPTTTTAAVAATPTAPSTVDLDAMLAQFQIVGSASNASA